MKSEVWPDGEELTLFAEYVFGIVRRDDENDDALKSRMRAKFERDMVLPTDRDS